MKKIHKKVLKKVLKKKVLVKKKVLKKAAKKKGVYRKDLEKRSEGGEFKKGNQSAREVGFQKGEINNPYGRPKTAKTLSDNVRKILGKPAASFPIFEHTCRSHNLDPEETTVAEVIALEFATQSMTRNSSGYVKELFDRIEGKVADQVIARISGFEDMDEAELDSIIEGEGKEEDD